MRVRPLLAAALAAPLAAHGAVAVAAARPKPKPPLCNLVTDTAGDVATGAQSLDIKSADVATDGRTVTGVIRLTKALKPTTDSASPTGGFYSISFTYNALGYTLYAHITPKGEEYGPGKGRGTYDLTKNEIRIHVSPGDMAGKPVFKPGALLTDLVVRTDVGDPAIPQGTTLYVAGDTATGNKPYPVGYPSCVKVGV
jgi:hypothetical protein